MRLIGILWNEEVIFNNFLIGVDDGVENEREKAINLFLSVNQQTLHLYHVYLKILIFHKLILFLLFFKQSINNCLQSVLKTISLTFNLNSDRLQIIK